MLLQFFIFQIYFLLFTYSTCEFHQLLFNGKLTEKSYPRESVFIVQVLSSLNGVAALLLSFAQELYRLK